MGKRRRKELYHAFTDGSCFMHEGRMGMGWVISRESNGKYRPGMQRLIYKGKPSSSLAEIYAVTTALHRVPERMSTVIVHTDDLALCNLINRANFVEAIQQAKKEPQREALTRLFGAVSSHQGVTAVHERQDHHAHLARAHHLSRAACWLKPKDNVSFVPPNNE